MNKRSMSSQLNRPKRLWSFVSHFIGSNECINMQYTNTTHHYFSSHSCLSKRRRRRRRLYNCTDQNARYETTQRDSTGSNSSSSASSSSGSDKSNKMPKHRRLWLLTLLATVVLRSDNAFAASLPLTKTPATVGTTTTFKTTPTIAVVATITSTPIVKAVASLASQNQTEAMKMNSADSAAIAPTAAALTKSPAAAQSAASLLTSSRAEANVIIAVEIMDTAQQERSSATTRSVASSSTPPTVMSAQVLATLTSASNAAAATSHSQALHVLENTGEMEYVATPSMPDEGENDINNNHVNHHDVDVTLNELSLELSEELLHGDNDNDNDDDDDDVDDELLLNGTNAHSMLTRGFLIPTFLPPFPAFAMADLPSYTTASPPPTTPAPTSTPALVLEHYAWSGGGDQEQDQLYLAAYNVRQQQQLKEAAKAVANGGSGVIVAATNVTVQLGSHAYMPCHIRRLTNKPISWVRVRDGHILSVDQTTFIADQRFQSIYKEENEYTWSLQIKYVQSADQGWYECQVSSEPKMSAKVYLSVVVPTTELIGEQNRFVKEGSKVALHCIVRGTLDPPTYIIWFRDKEQITDDNKRGWFTQIDRNIFGNMSINQNTIGSLIIPLVRKVDSGNYTCQPSNAAAVSFDLHVLNGEYSASAIMSAASGSQLHVYLHFFTALLAMAISTHELLART